MKRVLFLCVANSARSQMAEALAKMIWQDKAEVYSAGSQPSGKVNPLAIQALNKLDIDMSEHSSKSIGSLPQSFMNELDYIITLCAEEACPILPRHPGQHLTWPYPDPKNLEDFTRIRDQLKSRLADFSTQW